MTSAVLDPALSPRVLPTRARCVPLDGTARLVADALSIDVLLPRVAVLLRDAIPFERLHVLRLDRTESVTLYVVLASGELEVTGHLIGDAGAAVANPRHGTERSKIICTVR